MAIKIAAPTNPANGAQYGAPTRVDTTVEALTRGARIIAREAHRALLPFPASLKIGRPTIHQKSFHVSRRTDANCILACSLPTDEVVQSSANALHSAIRPSHSAISRQHS